MDPIYAFGIHLIQALQTMSPALDGVMKLFSFLGTVEFYILLIPVLYWLVDPHLGLRILLLLITTDFIGTSFKHLLRQPRPYWLGGVKALAEEASYGIPSTHASDSLAVWGGLAYHLKKGWLWAISGGLILLVALSRMYLGVHFPQDILGGWLIGGLVILGFAWGEGRISSWFKSLPQASQIGTGFGVSVLMIVIGVLILASIASSSDPAGWAGYSSESRSISHYFTMAGAFFGAVAGYVLMQRHAGFQAKGTSGQQAGRYVLGIAGVLVIYIGLDLLFALIAADETTIGYILRYLRYAIVALWVTFGAPWFFLRLKLAEPASSS